LTGGAEQPLACHDLTRYYDQVVGVEGLDLSFERGEVVGLIGLNGAGKSTTLRLAIGLLTPSRGQVLLFGAPARTAIAARRRIGFLPSEVPLYRNRTGRENLDLLCALGGHRPQDLAKRRFDLAARLGLAPLDLERPVKEMSHGMRQKIGLLQALEHDPDLVILDEPSDGLDPMARGVLNELVSEIRERGGTVLLASHVLSEIDRVADRVAVLHRGRLVALETEASLRQREAARIEVTFDGNAPDLSGLDGVRVVEREQRRLVLRARPPLDRIVKALATHPIASLTVREPSLDDLVKSIAGDPEER